MIKKLKTIQKPPHPNPPPTLRRGRTKVRVRKEVSGQVLVFCATVLFWLGVFETILYSADTVVISFEKEEGFSDAGKDFTGSSTNEGVVTKWATESSGGTGSNNWFTDDGPGGVLLPDAPSPISGTQIGGVGFLEGGFGINIGTMHLNKESKYTLTSFYWAYRGYGDSMPGGNAYLEVEYFDLNEKSIGKEKFQGGLAPDMNPKFDMARVSAQFQSVPLSKVIFRGMPPDPGKGHGTFLLDDVTLSKPGTKDVPAQDKVSKFIQLDTTPPTVRLPSPPPDSTVNGNPTISTDFADIGSGINASSAKVILDGKDVTSQAKVTDKGVSLTFDKPLEKGVHHVEVMVSDNAGNLSNRQSWRFGMNVPVIVKAEFKNGVFLVSSEPYFPMGIYSPIGPESHNSTRLGYAREASIAGINCQYLGWSTTREDMDIMLNRGMKVIKLVNVGIERISEANTEMIPMANEIKDHPALLCWGAFDPETIATQRENMPLAYKILKEQDPDHPVIWCGTCEKCIDSEDACSVYFYPLEYGNYTVKSIDSVVLQKTFRAAEPKGKQVWFNSQAIDLRIGEGERISPEDFRPSPVEMRAMNYLVLAKGVKGLFIYGDGGGPTPDMTNDLTTHPAQWKEAMKIASEVRYLSTVLAAGKLTKTVHQEPENSAIHYREIEHGGMHTVIAVNVADYPVSGTWRFPKPVQPMVLFEDRILSQKAQEMTDKFKPLEVHVYRWE